LSGNQITASPDDILEFIIRIDTTGYQNNVRVYDILPSQLVYISGSTKINNSPAYDGVTSSDGILVGNVNDNQEIIVSFLAKVVSGNAFAPGTTVINNTARVTTSALTREDQLTILISKNTSYRW
jgi:uncharacterized repeat protein (TIGR01451 family)